ncbi:hypothetical protein [Planococcus halotolerans]|uniref:hypothetical protein n=1 Tax=Planococcus halotolerans TaxID=2233542 RepID=UPI00197C0DBF|nr:hypothetical protein [Planococcus halotolerans]
MKKTILLTTGVIAALIIGVVIWLVADYFIESQIEDRNAREFIEEKYDMEAVIIRETNADFVNGHSYEMAFEEQRDVVFTVTVDVENYSTIYRDDYEAVRKLHELRGNMEKLMPEIEAIGFTEPSTVELAEHVVKSMKTGEAVRWLNLETEDSYETIERPEVQKVKELLDLQRKHGLDVQKILIDSKSGGNSVTMDLRTMEEVHSVEEVEAHVIGNDLTLAGKRFEEKWSNAAAEAETERFSFNDEFDDNWVSCHQVNHKGDCINLLANVTFAPGELSRQNPHLEEDLNAIFNFFDSIEPKMMQVDLVMNDLETEGNTVRLFLRERKNYESTEALIEDLVKG